MHAMVLRSARTALEFTQLDDPHPGEGQVAVKVHACGVCRTDLHVVDGELSYARSPVIPGLSRGWRWCLRPSGFTGFCRTR